MGGGGGWESGSQRIVFSCRRSLAIAGTPDRFPPDDIYDIESLVIIHNPFGNILARPLEGMTVLFLFPCQEDFPVSFHLLFSSVSPPASPSYKAPARYTTSREHAFWMMNVHQREKPRRPISAPMTRKTPNALRRTPNPEIPASNVQRHVLEAGETILAANEGAVHVVGCYADKNRGAWQGTCVRSHGRAYIIFIYKCAAHGHVHVPAIQPLIITTLTPLSSRSCLQSISQFHIMINSIESV